MKKNNNSFYMLYDPDDRELPLAVFDTIEELAEYTGKSINAVRSYICKFEKGIIKRPRYVRIKEETS